MIAINPEHAETVGDLNVQTFNGWKHHPVTAAFLHGLDVMIERYRELGADLIEAGTMREDNSGLRNPDVIRGQILVLRDLKDMDLPTLQGIFGMEKEDDGYL